ncbi:MAG: hypothetical protein ACUVYA_11730 [Planctomycetota bacterium]
MIRIWHKDRGEYGHTVIETCIRQTPWWNDEYVYIAGNHTGDCDTSCFYRLADDDNYNNAALSLKVSYPREPDCSDLDAALAERYMQHVPYPLTVRAAFDENVYDNELSGYITDPAHYSLRPAISDYFFTTHVVSAHQDAPRPPLNGADRDPGPGEGGHYTGGTPEAAVLGAAIPTDHGQCIYLEPIREFLASQSNIERAVLVHEIEHCCGASHDIGSGRVMEQFADNIAVVRFADKAKDEIRWKVWPPGGATDKIYNSPTP